MDIVNLLLAHPIIDVNAADKVSKESILLISI
jgi:hypothetical protein